MLKLNQKLKKLRIKNKLTQVELADKANTNSHTLSNFELGDCSPTINTVNNLFKALGYQLIVRSNKSIECDSKNYSNKQLVDELRSRLNDGSRLG